MRRFLFLAAALLAAAGCAKGLTPEARGKGVYASYDCKRCHKIGAEGGTTGPDLTYVGFRKSADFLDLWLKDPSAWQPDTAMPNFRFNDPTRRALAAYLATLKGEAESPERSWRAISDPVRRGAAIYERAGCVTCHGKAGKGGYRNDNVAGGKVPSLVKAADGFTKAELEKRIADGVARPVKLDLKGPAPMLHMPAWKEKLSPEDISAVADYVLSLRPPKAWGDAW